MRRAKDGAKPAASAYSAAMDAAGDARIHLDALTTPQRSLPMTGFKVLLGALIVFNLIVGSFFVAIGATPIPIFLGLDVLGVFIAFRISYRRAATRERLVITAEEVRVLRELKGRSRAVWTSPTAFTRVEMQRSGQYGAALSLALSNRRMRIGQALGPKEREDLATAIEAAIASARAERHPAP